MYLTQNPSLRAKPTALRGAVKLHDWQREGLGKSGGGAFWGDRAASAGRPLSRGTAYRSNTRPNSPAWSNMPQIKLPSSTSAQLGNTVLQLPASDDLASPSPELGADAVDLTYWRCVGVGRSYFAGGVLCTVVALMPLASNEWCDHFMSQIPGWQGFSGSHRSSGTQVGHARTKVE